MAFLRYILVTLLVTTSIHADESELVQDANPSARLKPLTPISKTNIFLNIPYKWHDHTKPGCFMTWVLDTYQDWSGQHRGLRLVCNKNDQQYYSSPNAEWIFEKSQGMDAIIGILGILNTTEYIGPVTVKNVGANYNLIVRPSAGTDWVGVHGDSLLLKVFGVTFKDKWTVRSDPNNKDHLQLVNQDSFLAQHQYENHQAGVYLKKGDPVDFPYTFVPSIDLEANIKNFEFTRPYADELFKHTSKKALRDSFTIKNNSPGTVTRQAVVNEKVTNEFSWGLSESLKVFAKAKGKAGVPLVAEGEVEAGFEINVGSTQNWKTSNEKSFSMSYGVTMPPYSEAKISAWYDLIKDVSMDYTATAEVTGKSSRITDFDDRVDDMPATGEMIRSYLENSPFDGTIIEVKKESVIVRFKGTMVASVGVNGRIDVNEETVAHDP